MPNKTQEVRPSPKPRHVITLTGDVKAVPADWALLPPGDAALSRRIKNDGPTWIVKERKGRKLFSRGIWAPAKRIEALRAELEGERSDPAYSKRLEAGRKRRALKQAAYAKDFEQAVLQFLNFHPRHQLMARELAKRIAQHTTPVGSGTVARTERISIEERAQAATIAWMRHQTTGYDNMSIPKAKGKRRVVRKLLAKQSNRILAQYRSIAIPQADECPLRQALTKRP